jgi:uncharacterized membrane protein
MQRCYFETQPWHLVPVKPGAEASFRRSNVIIISILGMLILGLLLVTFVPQVSSNATAATKDSLNY